MTEFFGDGPGGAYLLFSAWPSPDLTTSDFGRIGHPPLMSRPPGPVAVPAVDGLEIRRVDDASTARDWERALVEGFPLEELQPFEAGCLLPSTALEAPGWRHWIACLDGDPVGCASVYERSTHVEVEFISTIDAVRGRGVGRALTATATAVAGDRPAMLIASDLGRRLYERLGYHSILRVTLWAGDRPA